MKEEKFRLCFVYEGDAYFYKGDIKEVWGDDWDDAPYEHNCGMPYVRDGYEFKTIRIFKNGEGYSIDEPMDSSTNRRMYISNSPFSVKEINTRKVPWLRIYEGELEIKVLDEIYAGDSIEKVIKILDKHGVDYIVKDKGMFLEQR